MNITKNSITNHINDKLGISKNFLNDIVNSVFENIVELTIQDSNLKIKNFGSFIISKKKSRLGNIIHENKKILIEERLVLKFSPSKSLKERINKIL
jgi:nucleoid DNA-binding protein